MKIDDLLRLVDAGFTASEIRNFTGEIINTEIPQASPDTAPEDPETVTAEEDPTDQSSDQTPQEAPQEAPAGYDYIKELRSEIADLRKIIQVRNVQTAEQSADRSTQKTDTDIIASIIKGG